MAPEDLDLNRQDAGYQPDRPPARPSHRAVVAGVIIAALIAGAAARWWFADRPAPAASSPPVNATASTEGALPPAVVLPPMDQMDSFLRTMLSTLSSRPELARWLATDNLLQQMAVAIDRIAAGASPARQVPMLAPKAEFDVETRGRVRTIDPDSYDRYDGLAETVATLDATGVAASYRTIKPRLNEAYRGLGRSEADVEVALVAALDVLIATPIPKDPITVVEGKGATWVYADPSLERLDPAQKQLLRMGPANAARVIEKLRDIRRQIQP